MKNVILITFLLISVVSCLGKKTSGTKSNFKILIGAQVIGVPLLGGAFIETEDLGNNTKKILKLDAQNNAEIPLGTYNILFIAFTGPAEKSGAMYCGSVSNAALLNPTSTMEVTLSQTACPQQKYTDFKDKLLGIAIWDTATFDSGKWGQ